jgi:hypothetical protein
MMGNNIYIQVYRKRPWRLNNFLANAKDRWLNPLSGPRAGMDAGYRKFVSFCKEKTQSEKTAGMPFFRSARD